MPAVYTYTEAADNTSPSSASFAVRQQSAGGVYYTTPTVFKDMPNRLIDVLGYTGTKPLDPPNAGKLNRVLPLRHAQYQWLFADSFRPRGKGTDWLTITPSPGVGSALIVNSFPLMARYECDVAFSPRDYNVWQDKDIKIIGDQVYYPKDDSGSNGMGGNNSPDNTKPFSYAYEWMRFCIFELTPLNNFIDAKSGLMKFRVDGGGSPNGIDFQDSPRMFLPDSSLKVRWYGVPYRYLSSSNSYLRKFIGHINQAAWGDEMNTGNPANPSFGPYPAGSLLYLGSRPIAIYSNVVPDEGLLGPAQNGTTSFSRSRLCDLEMDFVYTARTATFTPPDFAAVNRNWITAGHNLLPHLQSRGFAYASSYDQNDPTNQAKWYPTFRSFRFELLFTDPDTLPGSPLLDP